jgi:hypothetical protein
MTVKRRISLLLLVLFGFSAVAHGDNKADIQSGYPFKSIAVDASGNLYVANNSSYPLYKITPGGQVTALGDEISTGGYISGIAADALGNVYVVDSVKNTIRKISPGGVVTTLAGSSGVAGSANGTGTAATFSYPSAIAVDADGNVYVADTQNELIRKITPGGVVTTLAGGGVGSGVSGGAVNGTGTAASFAGPVGVAVGISGNVYVVDRDNQSIRKITPGGVVTTLAGSPGAYGCHNGTGSSASFDGPFGIAVDSSENIYVADYGSNMIRKITPGGVVTTLAGSLGSKTNSGWNNSESFLGGFADGTGTQALFFQPYGVAADQSGNVYVADSGNNSIRKVSPRGEVTTLLGSSTVASTQSASKSSPIVSTDNCYGGYPRGVPKDSERGKPLYVDYDINFTYQPENPKESPQIAEFFTTFLNEDAKTEGSGLSFVQAEGHYPNLRFYVTISHNSTVPDHFSFSVRVTGATVDEGNSENVSGVNFFTIDHAPFTYTDDGAGQIIEDAAKDVQNNLANGWSCQ